MKLNLEFEVEQEGVDMCKALERRYLEKEITGAIRMLRADGASDETIIAKVMNLFHVTKEYVLNLMREQVA